MHLKTVTSNINWLNFILPMNKIGNLRI